MYLYNILNHSLFIIRKLPSECFFLHLRKRGKYLLFIIDVFLSMKVLITSSRLEVLCKKGAFKDFANSQERTCAGVIFIKKETLAQVFFSKFCEIFKNIYFYRTPAVADSLLPPIRAAEIVECVRKYMDGSSQNLQCLSSY